MGNHYPGYAFLGYDCWVRRERIPVSLLACYDRTFAVAETNPGEIDPETGRSFGALWLDVADDIRERAVPLLDRVALRASLQADDLRKRGELRALDAMLSRGTPRP